MSTKELLLNIRKPWCNIRVEDITIDGDTTNDGPVIFNNDVTFNSNVFTADGISWNNGEGTLDYYEHKIIVDSYTGAAATTATLLVVRSGKNVTITSSGCSSATYSAATLIFPLLDRFRPSRITYFPICGKDNNAAAYLTAIVYDTITIGVGAGAVNFAAAIGEVKPFSISYNIA